MNNNLVLNCCIKQERHEDLHLENRKIENEPKIPRPPNAFMLYANENRKIMAQQFPADSNKEISRKLGSSWKSLDADEKSRYFERAKEIDLEHKKKYPNYVYNPKEARLRKAIREASRDRAIGASPMLPRPNARRATPHAWMPGQHDDQIMMPTIRCPPVPTGLDPSPCYPGTGNEPFMAMAPSGYCTAAKMESPLPPPPPPQASVAQNAGGVHHPSSYIQPNPLAQLQQQTEMWPGFQDDLRPRSSGNPYMLQEVPPTHHYHHQPSPPLSIPSPMMLDKHRHTPLSLHSLTNPSTPITPPHSNSNLSLTPPHSNENVPPEELRNQTVKVSEDSCGFESKQQIMEQVTQPLMETNNVQHHQQNDGYMSVLSPELQAAHHQQQLDKAQEDAKIKKTMRSSQFRYNVNPPLTKRPSSKALPDFNEAFGSTERGRFQSPPDPNRGPNKCLLDFFFEDTALHPIKFDDFQI